MKKLILIAAVLFVAGTGLQSTVIDTSICKCNGIIVTSVNGVSVIEFIHEQNCSYGIYYPRFFSNTFVPEPNQFAWFFM